MDQLSKADREYREKLRKLNKWLIAVIGIMIICATILFSGILWYDLEINDHAIGFLAGLFSSLSIISIGKMISNRRIMNNHEKLKQQRIAHYDERNIAIVQRALYISTYVMIFVLFILAMIGSFVSRQMLYIAGGLIYVYLISYLISYFYFKKKL